MTTAPNYLNPEVPADLPRHTVPVIDATAESVEGYGRIFRNPEEIDIEIVRWPPQGWRPVDPDSGDEGGTTEGTFFCEWQGDVLFGKNEAVGGHYILGYGEEPTAADESHTRDPERVLIWHSNYHPDGGQLFFPLDQQTYYVPAALPGDDVKPEDYVCFRVPGDVGLYIHPNIWHDGVFPRRGSQRFFGRQGRVHARVSVDFPREFGCLLEVPLD
ncbi:MAG: ureidoglycolate hydrolase [Planctomycetota bacterium]|nr:MAG: ureidoglycolate hydrolase [Planctomycetota bacterium]REK44339.1 MAG: ureidoglycolate hydrolase [Planctomycetota bacterium]